MIVLDSPSAAQTVSREQRRADRLMTETIEAEVKPLFQVNTGLGWLRLLGLLVPSLACLWMYWQEPRLLIALPWLLVATGIYALVLISTHDISHGTLLGQRDLEQGVGCALSWPVGWPYLTYRNLHMLHHRMNGMDLRDPERREPTSEEAAQAHPLRQWHFRHPFWGSALLMGGAQLIGSMFWFGWKLRHDHSRLLRGMRIDAIGIVLVQAVMFTVAIQHGELLKLLLMLFVVERIVGAVMQVRGMIEHHGLWQPSSTYELTQLYTSRNIDAGPLVNVLMGGLPHHSLHHAYPSIPYHNLPEASRIASRVLKEHGKPPLPLVCSYGSGTALLF
jgi:fatty acid desaturase